MSAGLFTIEHNSRETRGSAELLRILQYYPATPSTRQLPVKILLDLVITT